MKAVTAVKNEVKDREQFSDVAKTDLFKPLIDQQKRTDEKQDKVIEQLKDNQLAITEGIQDIVTLNDLLKKDNEYLNPYYESVKEKRNEISNEIVALKRTKTKDVSDEIKEKEDVKTSINKYLSAISDEIIALKRYLPKTGKGASRSASRKKQPKRNAYKITDSQYGGLLIDVPELMNRMKLKAFRDGKLVYEADADLWFGMFDNSLRSLKIFIAFILYFLHTFIIWIEKLIIFFEKIVQSHDVLDTLSDCELIILQLFNDFVLFFIRSFLLIDQRFE